MIQELAALNIFLPSNITLEEAVHSSEYETNPDFSLTCQGLCYAKQLFSDHTNAALSLLLPEGKTAPFHQWFLSQCLEMKLPNLLIVYCNHYKLVPHLQAEYTRNPEKISKQPEPEWFLLYLQLYGRANLFEASFSNAKLLNTLDTGKDLLFQFSSPLTSIGTIMLCRSTFPDEIGIWPKFHDLPNRHQTFFRGYPVLHSLLFSNFQMPVSTSLRSQLLEMAQTAFGFDQLHGPSPDEGLHDTPDIHLFLANHRPFAAFRLFQQNALDAFVGPKRILSEYFHQKLVVPQNSSEAPSAKWISRYTLICGLAHLLDPAILASCSVFMELFFGDSKSFRVDIEAASRIYNHRISQEIHKSRFHLQDVVTLFLGLFQSFERESDDPSLNSTSLDLLSDSNLENTKSCLLALEEATKNSESSLTSKWLLVTLFCSVHDLLLSSGHLCELAESGDWETFLYEVELEQFPPEQILHISDYFSDFSVKSHLKAMLTVAALDQNPDFVVPPENCIDLFDSSHSERLSQNLLKMAKEHEEPEAALLSAHLEKNSKLEILQIYLEILAKRAGIFCENNSSLSFLIVDIAKQNSCILLSAFSILDPANILFL